jgi:hypothetical protein
MNSIKVTWTIHHPVPAMFGADPVVEVMVEKKEGVLISTHRSTLGYAYGVVATKEGVFEEVRLDQLRIPKKEKKDADV